MSLLMMINDLHCDITVAEPLLWRSLADAYYCKGDGAFHHRDAVPAMRRAHFQIGLRDSAAAVPQHYSNGIDAAVYCPGALRAQLND